MATLIISRVLLWIKSARALYTITVLLPCCMGAIVAWYQGYPFQPGLLALMLVGMMFANIGTNFTNDYFDYRSGVDSMDEGRRFKKGAEVLLEDPLAKSGSVDAFAAYFFSPRAILASAIGSYLVSMAVGVALALKWDWRVLPIGIAGILMGFFYTAPPVKFGYRGLGDLICFLGSGPFPVAGTYFLFTGTIGAAPLLAGCIEGLLVDAILYIGNVPDADADRSVGKITLSTIFGRKAVRVLAPAYYGVTAALLVASVAARVFPVWCLLALLALPIVVRILSISRRHYDEVPRFAAAILMTVAAFTTATILLGAGFAIARALS